MKQKINLMKIKIIILLVIVKIFNLVYNKMGFRVKIKLSGKINQIIRIMEIRHTRIIPNSYKNYK